jgi:mRNA-degrading endonuclease toxin of MazEF toxin-antitoxin module
LQHHSFAVDIVPPEGGLTRRSVVLCHHLRTISVDRLGRRLGVVEEPTSKLVLQRVCRVLGADAAAF